MPIQEKNLPKHSTDISATDYLRIVLSSGASKDVLKSLLAFPISQITGLADTLAAKASKEDTAALKGFLGYVKSDGDLGGSGFTLSDVTALTIDDIKNGLALASTPFAVDVCGTVYGVLAVGNIPVGENADGSTATASVQLIFGSLGVFYRIFNVNWGAYAYVGGSLSVRSYSRSDLLTLMGDDKLTPGTQYKINDHGGDAGIIVTAGTSNSLFSDALRLTYIPAFLGIGEYENNNWIGEWNSHLTDVDVVGGDLCTFMGRVWNNIHGAIGTASGWDLDTDNWEFVDYSVSSIYAVEVHGCRYDIRNDGVSTSGWIGKEWDNRGNKFGIEFDDLSGFRTEYCLWGSPYVYGNELKSVRNCIVGATTPIYNNVGHGDIYDISYFDVHENQLTTDGNNIRNCFSASALTKGHIYKNTLSNDADIQYIAASSDIHFNTIESDLKGDSTAYCTATVTESHIGAEQVKDNVTLIIESSKINGTIDGNTYVKIQDSITESASVISGNTKAWVVGSKICHNAYLSSKDMATFALVASILDFDDSSVETYTANKYIETRPARLITGSYYLGAGTLSIPTGATYSAPTILTGCAQTTIRENGVTIGTRQLTAKYAGWYRLKYEASVLCQTNNVITESAVYVNSTLKQAGYNSKTYPVSDAYINSSISVQLLLAVGDVVTVRHRHNNGGAVTFTLGQINMELEYDN